MKIEAFILCHNEAKFVRHTLNHYKKICSHINVIDNESTDDSVNIIRTEYPDVEIITYKSEGVLNDGMHQQLKNTCWKNSDADWVIVCDMDELLYHPDLLNRLKAMSDKFFVLPLVYGYNMFSETFPEDYSRPITDQVKNGVRAYHFDKQIIFDPKRVAAINYGPGAHTFQPEVKPGSRLDAPKSVLLLLHYKYMGEEYLINKHGYYATRISEFNKQHNFGSEYAKGSDHVRECFKLIRNSGKIEQVVKP